MRTILAAGLLLVAGAGAGGQDKKAEPRYDPVKELDRKAKAALEVVRKRDEGYIDKGIIAFGEVITRADPKSAPSQQVARHAAYFLLRLHSLKEGAAYREYQLFGGDDQLRALEKVRADRELWAKILPPGVGINEPAVLSRTWDAIEREWAIEDLKKK
jgi:hypothetical protein